jgi:tRNA 2-selenouridine synthase
MQSISITAQDLCASWADFDTVIDARSPGEWQADHLPGAVNLPVLNDAERIQVGTLYASSAFDAKKMGAALVAQNIAIHLQQTLYDKPKSWRPLVYCWRGGNRSNAFATVLQRIGWKVAVLEGGYTAFRRFLIQDLDRLAASLQYQVVCGVTGSGKSQYLRRLAEEGHQVLDLEALAHHRGSLLGSEPMGEQPTQKAFETRLWHALGQFDPALPVYVESESRKIGQVQVPPGLIEKMRQSDCIELQCALEDRAAFLCSDYDHFFNRPDQLVSQLDRLKPLVGNELLATWHELIAQKDWDTLVRSLLVSHYDPTYMRSMKKNYARYAQAERRPYQPVMTASQ